MTKNPAFAPELLTDPTAQAVVTCSTCRRSLTMQLKVQNDTILAAGGEVEGCPYSRDCLGILCKLVTGKSMDDAWLINEQDIRAQHTGPKNPKQDLDCDVFVVAALKLALRNQVRAMGD